LVEGFLGSDVPRVENDFAADMRRRAVRMALIALPVLLVAAIVLSWAALSASLSKAAGVAVPWWELGPIVGLLLWAFSFAMMLSVSRSSNANQAPRSIDLTSDGMVVLLPPVLGSSEKVAREVAVTWGNVDRVDASGFIRPGFVWYHRAGTPPTTVGGLPQGEFLVVTAATALQVERAWKAWKARDVPA
jgi:hypothetical protein